MFRGPSRHRISVRSMIRQLFASALLAVTLGACGGGGVGGYGGPAPVGPTPPPAGAPLQTSSLKGSPGFVNSNNMTVYVFDADLGTPNASTCSGTCAQNWPPVTVAAGASLPAPWTSFMRADGSMQLAYKTRALYTFAFDHNAGDVNGDGVNAFGGVWHIGRP
jgi:predicted lipoprotein with Yx(FWY)xxD motif